MSKKADTVETNSGWVCLHRAIDKHWIWEDCNLLGAWIKIISEVNHSPRKVLIKGKILEVKRGESVKSLESWTKIMGKRWTKDKFRTFLKLLKTDHMITTVNEGVTLRLTVTNYDKYQTKPTEIPQKPHARPTHVPPNNNDNNDNNIKYSNSFKKPKVEEVEKYAKSIQFNLKGDDFIDFYESKGWMIGKNKMKDWKAAVRTWKKRSGDSEVNLKSGDVTEDGYIVR